MRNDSIGSRMPDVSKKNILKANLVSVKKSTKLWISSVEIYIS